MRFLDSFIQRALQSQGLVLANRIAPVISASILLTYVFSGRRSSIVNPSSEEVPHVRTYTARRAHARDFTNLAYYNLGGG